MRLGLILVTLLGTRLAIAEPDLDPGEPVAVSPADKLFDEGRALLEAGKAAEACVKFEESYKLDATAAGLMLNLGLCNEQLGKLATAIKWFRRAVNRAAEHSLTEVETAAREKAAALTEKIATLRLEVTAPKGRTVTLDGTRVDEVELGRLEVDAGHHVLELTAPNAPTVKREVDVVDGKALTIQLVTSEPPPPKKYEIVDLGVAQRRKAYVIGGIGAGVMVASGVLGFVGKSRYDDGESPKDWDRWQSIVRYGGTSLFVVGAGLVTYAAIVRWRAPGKERREIVATPVITPGQVGFAVARSF